MTTKKADPKRVRRVTVNPTVWALIRLPLNEHLGVFSSEEKAKIEAVRIITREAGLTSLRVPPFQKLLSGGQELVYGRDARSWHLTLEPWPVDGVKA